MGKKESLIQTPMEKLTQGYEKLIKDRKIKSQGKGLFDNAIKKAVKPKPRGSK